MRARLTATMQPLLDRWHTYGRQERMTWTGLGLLAAGILLWLYAWQPLMDRQAQAHAELQRAQENLEWIQQMAPRVRAASASIGESADPEAPQSMTNAISQAAQRHDLALTRFEQSGEDGLRIWLDNQAFSDVLAWVATLETQGFWIDQMTISQANESGLVNVRGVYTRQ